MKKYYLLLWPESQEWIGHPEAICAGYDYSEDDNLSLDQALFIPCELYDEIYGRKIIEKIKNRQIANSELVKKLGCIKSFSCNSLIISIHSLLLFGFSHAFIHFEIKRFHA